MNWRGFGPAFSHWGNGMTDFLDIQDDIIDELGDEGALSRDQVKKAIVRSIRQYERMDFWFTQAVGTFNSVAGQEYYTTAALADIPNMVEILSLKRTSNDLPLVGATLQDVEAQSSSTATGTPTHYSLVTGKIRLYPIPTEVEQFKVIYTKRFTELDADDDTNDWLSFAEELIRQSAKRRIAMDILHSDEIAARCGAAEKMALDALEEENRRRRPKKYMTVGPMPALSESFNIVTGI